MASATLPIGSPTLLPDRSRRWPASAGARWGLRLALALPLVGLGIWAQARGFESASHRTFDAQAAAVRAGGSDLAGMAAAYPPTPTLLAGLVPGGTLGLSVVVISFPSYRAITPMTTSTTPRTMRHVTASWPRSSSAVKPSVKMGALEVTG